MERQQYPVEFQRTKRFFVLARTSPVVEAKGAASAAITDGQKKGAAGSGNKGTKVTPVTSALATAVQGPGALSENLPVACQNGKKFYLTTAISYTNGFPHMGHAYEFLTSDAIVRYHRVLGFDSFFLTGTDEHGQKVAASAAAANRTPIEHCDIFVAAFQALNKRLLVSCDDFIRTTSPHHERTSQLLWKRVSDAGDIYLSAYEGWYSEREEAFVSDADAEASGFVDPGTGLPLKRVTEESYFFRMSAFTDRLIAHIESHPSFIQPEQFRNNILGRLRKEGLRDLSISRTSFSWGIPVPEGFDRRHVMYVWFDALTNYLSGINALGVDNAPTSNGRDLSKFWPANRHVIGKDIVWFHCVIWPCMLMSAQLPLPEGVFSHGFVNAADGRKMSKSFNNTIQPMEILDKYPVDSLRYYVCSSVTYGADMNFSEDSLVAMHNSELADVLGNLVHRVLNLCHKYCGGVIPSVSHDPAFSNPFDLNALKAGVVQDMESCAIHSAIFRAMEAARSTNRFLTEAEPWKLKGDEFATKRQAIVKVAMEAVYAFAHFLAPVMPIAAGEIFTKLNTPPTSAHLLRDDFSNLQHGTVVIVGDILFQKIETNQGENAAVSLAESNKSKPTKGKAGAAKSAESKNEVDESCHSNDFTKLDLRVGRIVKVWNHPTAERLYCEEIDVGAEVGGVRQVASGLRSYYSLEQLQGRLVVVVCNLKESKFQGFNSQGMVLAAKSTTGDKLELLEVPDGTAVGERVYLRGQHDAPAGLPPARIKKLKVWETVSPDLKANESGCACWQGTELETSRGTCSLPSLTDVLIG